MAPFMDGIQLPQGYRTTTRRHLLFTNKWPGLSGTHLMNFHRMKG